MPSIVLEAESDHALRAMREWKGYREAVADVPAVAGLSAEHCGDVAVALSKFTPTLVSEIAELTAGGDHARIATRLKSELQALRRADPALFDLPPLKSYLARLMSAARNAGLGFGGDNDSLRASADRMTVEDGRRVAYAIRKALAARNLPIPAPQEGAPNPASEPFSAELQRAQRMRGLEPLDPADSPTVLMRTRRQRALGNQLNGGIGGVATASAPSTQFDDAQEQENDQ